MPPAPAAIEAKGLAKTHRAGAREVEGLSLRIEPGEVFATR